MHNRESDVAQEAEWIKRCQQGEREAFEPLVGRYQRRVFSLVLHLVRRRDQAEDLAQEIFIKAFVGIRKYDFRSPFVNWLSQVAVNHCYDYLRRERSSRVKYYWQMNEDSVQQLESSAENPEAWNANPERQAAFRELASKLLDRAPVNDRILLGLKELEDLSVEEIAEVLGLKPGTVKVRLHRARKRMLNDMKLWLKGG